MKIGIIVAMKEELEIIGANIKNRRESRIYGRKIYMGEIQQVSVVIMLGGIGKVNAAIYAQILISNFKINALINTGLASALNPKYEIGDIIIGDGAFQHDYGSINKNRLVTYKVGAVPEIGNGDNNKALIQPLPMLEKPNSTKRNQSSDIIAKHISLINDLFYEVTVNHKDRKPKIHQGTIATGDQSISNEFRKKEIRELGADVIEMEGAAIAQTAYIFDIPLMIIRIISDKNGKETIFNLSTFIAEICRNNSQMIIHLFAENARILKEYLT